MAIQIGFKNKYNQIDYKPSCYTVQVASGGAKSYGQLHAGTNNDQQAKP